MSDSEYADIAFEAREVLPPFRFNIDGAKFELPNLRGPNVPVELFATALLFTNGSVPDDKLGQLGKTFVDYFENTHPALVRALNRHPQTLPMLNGLIRQWSKQEAKDPKAFN